MLGQLPRGVSYPSTGYAPTGQQGAAPASGYTAPQVPPPRRARRKPPRKRNILLAIAALFLIGAIGDALGVGVVARASSAAD